MLVKFLVLFNLMIILTSCSSSDNKNTLDKNETISWYKPTLDASFQWQLTGNLNKSYDVNIYDIDLFDTSIETIEELQNSGKKVICYFSAGSYENWREDASSFPNEILGKDLDGWAGEKWLDISSDLLKPIMIKRLDIASQKGCDGVEPDNVDGYSNDTGFSFTALQQREFNIFLANEAHKRGLSIGLKNDIDNISKLEPYFDFAVNEQCNYYNECENYSAFTQQNKPVFNIEYDVRYLDDDNMTKLCNINNDRNITTLIMPNNLDDAFRHDCKTFIYDKFKVGYGGASAFKFHDNKWLNSIDLMDGNFSEVQDEITDFNVSAFSTLSTYLQKSRYVVFWFTKGWQESWFSLNKIQKAMDEGKIPVFIYWYFGDDLINGFTNEKINAYKEDVLRVNNFLSQLKGEQLFILEPEFNKDIILNDSTNSTNFIDVLKDAISVFKQKDRKISICMMDTGSRGVNNTKESCGYSNCSLGDKNAWDEPTVIYDALLPYLDFISFQEMIGQFSRDDSNPGDWDNPIPKAYSDAEIGIDFLANRIDNFAIYLKDKYKKPVFLPYITIATATWDDNNNDSEIDENELNPNGWNEKASNAYRDLNSTSLFGYATMELFDNPTHDKGGYQYFINNEYHLGIVTSDINDSQLTGNIKFKSDILDNIFKD